MDSADRRGFDWKEIAEVLHLTRAMDRSIFWSKIKKLGQKKNIPAPAIAPHACTRRGAARAPDSERSMDSSLPSEQED